MAKAKSSKNFNKDFLFEFFTRFCDSQKYFIKPKNTRKYLEWISWVVQLRATQIGLKSIKEASNKSPAKATKRQRESA